MTDHHKEEMQKLDCYESLNSKKDGGEKKKKTVHGLQWLQYSARSKKKSHA